MKVATAEQMQELDRKAIETYRIPGIVLMENAGRGAAEVISNAFPDILKKKVAIIAGKGNNGGDGFVIGRHFLNQGIPVKAFLLADPKALTGGCRDRFPDLPPHERRGHPCSLFQRLPKGQEGFGEV